MHEDKCTHQICHQSIEYMLHWYQQRVISIISEMNSFHFRVYIKQWVTQRRISASILLRIDKRQVTESSMNSNETNVLYHEMSQNTEQRRTRARNSNESLPVHLTTECITEPASVRSSNARGRSTHCSSRPAYQCRVT